MSGRSSSSPRTPTSWSDALTERPDAVVVCEKHEGQSHFSRLSSERLREWLDEYRLGEIWPKGVIGGNPILADLDPA